VGLLERARYLEVVDEARGDGRRRGGLVERPRVRELRDERATAALEEQ
jgi:hypothetical protein